MCFKRGHLLVAFAKQLLKVVTEYAEFVWFTFAVNLVGSSDDNLNFKFKGYLIVNWLIGQMVG